MRLLLPALALVVLAGPVAAQQKLGYVDSERILALMPEYRTAQQDVDRLATQWQAEVDALGREAETLQADYAARELLYTSEERTRGLDEIAARRQAADALRRRYFGPEGELFREQQSRLRPVQERLLDCRRDRRDRRRLRLHLRPLGRVRLPLHPRPQRRHGPRARRARPHGRAPAAPRRGAPRPGGDLQGDPARLSPRARPRLPPRLSLSMTARLFGALALALVLPAAAQAQAAFKVGFIDTDQIVVRTPEYAQVQTRLQAEQETVGTRVRFVQDSLNTVLQTQARRLRDLPHERPRDA